MRDFFKQQWRTLKRGKPGHRFQARYAAARQARRKAGGTYHLFRIVRLIAALAAIAVGFVLMFIPGPAVLFFFIAGSLLATESKTVARLFDWTEVKARALWRRGHKHWNHLPNWGRSLLVGFGACVSFVSAYVSYRLMVR